MAPAPITTQEVLTLRKGMTKAAGSRMELLRPLLGRPVRSPKALRVWHDLLLFLIAYPNVAEEHAAATSELQRVVGIAQDMAQRNGKLRYALINSGVEGIALQSTYTLRITAWMLKRWQDRVELFSVEAPLDECVELIRLLLPHSEMETVDQPVDDVAALLERVFGPSRGVQLVRLVHLFLALQVDDRTRELLWSRMQVFVKVEGAPGCGMSFARSPVGPVHVQSDEVRHSVELAEVLEQRVGGPLRLGRAAPKGLIDTARTVLATLHRETDPVTFAGAAELFDMGGGLRVALFHLDVEHRLPFDSYVGFMAFKNGVPLAYGGAWIFPGRSKVGINVFPALRGGNSAWFFAQLLRLYRQRFHVDRFEAENYQLGHNNPDGLKSGAYWFYYRLGFRPTTKALQRSAEREYPKLRNKAGHSVPLAVMKELVENGLELIVAGSDAPVIDTAALTVAAQHHVVHRYGGERELAEKKVMARLQAGLPLGDLRRWTPASRHALALWAPALDMIPDLENWTKAAKRDVVRLVRCKGDDTETDHQLQLRDHRAVLTALHKGTPSE